MEKHKSDGDRRFVKVLFKRYVEYLIFARVIRITVNHTDHSKW